MFSTVRKKPRVKYTCLGSAKNAGSFKLGKIHLLRELFTRKTCFKTQRYEQ